MSDSAQTPTQTSTVTQTSTPTPPKPEKKPPSQAKLAALAKARAANSQKALERKATRVVRDDNSAEELLDRVQQSDSEAHVVKRTGGKRKGYEGRVESSSSGNGATIKYVTAGLAIAGLAYLGSQKGFKFPTMGTTSTPTPETAGTPSPAPSGPTSGAVLSTSHYTG
jgi:hypothetical protein